MTNRKAANFLIVFALLLMILAGVIISVGLYTHGYVLTFGSLAALAAAAIADRS